MPKHSSKRKPKKSSKNALFQSKAFTVFAMFGIIVIVISLTKEVIRKVEISKQIETLEQEVAELEQHNVELGDLMQYFNSSSFQEKEARKKLGLLNEGETVVMIPGEENYGDISNSDDQEVIQDVSNMRKWKKYFFSN
ncbi:MAG: septum formation initiator family protein [bacterium]|nr:septum formation initiator family protein [bacterium]